MHQPIPYPKWMYKGKTAVIVHDQAAHAALGSDWAESPAEDPAELEKEFPKTKFHSSGASATVHDEEAEAALGAGWSDEKPAHAPEAKKAKKVRS
jgi:hypothetical protein